jgi:lysophospholipase L1-like esterase
MTQDPLAAETADPLVLSPDEAARLLRDAPWRRLAVMGDSFAAGVGGPTPGYADQPWPNRLRTALGTGHPDFAYLNTGVVGLRTAEVRVGQLDRVLAFKPDLVNVAAGGNDLFVEDPDLDAVEAELDEIYAALRAQGADVFAFTVANVFDVIPALAALREPMAALNRRIRAVAMRHGAILVEMWEHPVRLRPDLLSPDGVHFAMVGHAALATEIIRTLSQRAQAQRAADAADPR